MTWRAVSARPYLEAVPSDVPGLIALTKSHPDEAAPWYGAYDAQLDRTLMFAEHEAVDHPAGPGR